jgi:glycosidase
LLRGAAFHCKRLDGTVPPGKRFSLFCFDARSSENFMQLWPSLLMAGFLCCASSTLRAQATLQPISQIEESKAEKPQIEKIDPPGWWSGLPDPVLLVHGEGLDGARFAVQGKDVTLSRTQISENGHWAFLWLRTATAAPQTLWITARTPHGQAHHQFQLAERSQDPNGHRGFSSADVLYLVMIDRFADGNPANNQPGLDRAAPHGWHGGDLAGIEQHIDYLHELGVTALWTTPVASNGAMPQSYHGYAATDLYAVDAHFGTLDDYRHLSDALHAKGMKLVIDLVPNHLGVQHPWIADPPAPDWFHGTLQQHRATQHDFYELVDPHAPEQARSAITTGWFTDAMPDLNQENPLVSQYLIQNALWWVETANLDGIRLDTFPYVDRAFWRDFHATLHSVYPHLTTVGEIFHRDPEVTSFFAGGAEHRGIDTGLDTPFDFPVYFALRDVLTQGKPMTELAQVLRQDALYPHPERLVPFIGNHDTTRFLTQAGDSVPRLKLAFGLLATLRGMPQIYSGDEIGMDGGDDPDNRRDFPGGFQGDAHNAFTKAGRTANEQDIFAWTAGLLALRSAHPELQTGIEQNLFADADLFAFVRAPADTGCSPDHSTRRLLIVVNKAQHNNSVELPVAESALADCVQFSVESPSTGTVPVLNNGKLHIEELAESITVYEVK